MAATPVPLSAPVARTQVPSGWEGKMAETK